MTAKKSFTVALFWLALCTSATAQEAKTFPLKEPVIAQDVLVCKTLEKAREVADATLDGKKFAEVVMSLQMAGECGRGRGVVVYHALVYKSKGPFRVYSFTPIGSETVYYEVTDWKGKKKKGVES